MAKHKTRITVLVGPRGMRVPVTLQESSALVSGKRVVTVHNTANGRVMGRGNTWQNVRADAIRRLRREASA